MQVMPGSVAGSSSLTPDESGIQHKQSPEVKAFRKTAINVTFPGNGLTLNGWLYKPAGGGPFPAVIWNHGSERNPIAHPELGLFYTRHGYALFLPVRHGHVPSPGDYIEDVINRYAAEGHRPDQVEDFIVRQHELYNADVVAAIQWLKKQSFVDTDRIVVSGCSYGGIQTLLTAEKGLGLRAAISFAPGAMSWSNRKLQQREIQAVRNAKVPVLLLQAANDYSLGPSNVLGPIIKSKGAPNNAIIYPAFGTSRQEGHAGFASWQEGTAIWGDAVLTFMTGAGAGPETPNSPGQAQN
jgi:dienelactone hydrolase